MKYGIYIVYEELDGRFDGVNKKIRGQIEALKRQGISVETVVFKIGASIKARILYRLPFINMEPCWHYINEFDSCDFIYLRKPYLSLSFILFLHKIKKQSKAKVIMELPTYPYDGELKKRIIDYPLYVKDLFARKFLHGNADRIACLTNDEIIFNVKTLKILNGFDFSQFRMDRKPRKDCIQVCCVAKFEPWHGYERLLNGLIEYYKGGGVRSIIVHMIGDGEELNLYKKIVNKGSLNDRVIFHGYKTEKEIEGILNECDFGVASLGLYKINFTSVGCFLKTREYLAAGLPIIAGSKLDIMEYPELNPYVLAFENNPSDIDLHRVVKFYDELHQNSDDVAIAVHIRNVAEKKLNIDAALKNVIDYINSI